MKYNGLTLRQLEVARLIADGRTDAQIARALGVRVNTVYFHVKRIAAAWRLSDGDLRVLITLRLNRTSHISVATANAEPC